MTTQDESKDYLKAPLRNNAKAIFEMSEFIRRLASTDADSYGRLKLRKAVVEAREILKRLT